MNIRGHFDTITHHKLLVMKYCFACGCTGRAWPTT